MWLLTTKGSYSIVEKPWDKAGKTLTIRARVENDLISLKSYLPSAGDIIESSDSDYRYRITAPRAEVESAMARLTAEIDYDNFKDAVASRQGYDRAITYGEVWKILYKLQTTAKNIKKAK